MTVGKKSEAIPENDLLEDYYDNLHRAYAEMRNAFSMRAQAAGITQDELALKLDTDKSIISKRLKGNENLTLKSLSWMASALACRILFRFQPYEEIDGSNYYRGWNRTATATTSTPNAIMPAGSDEQVAA